MKKTLIALLIVTPVALSLSGCIVSVGGEDGRGINADFEDREYDNRKKIASIPLNSNINDVTNKMGVADFNETFQRDVGNIQVLYYRTHRLHKDGVTTKDECTYLHFVNGVLVDTGNGGDYSRNVQH